MSRSTQKRGTEHELPFDVYTSAGAGVASLTASDFTILLSRGATNLSTAGVTITEVGGAGNGGGRYVAKYTDDGTGGVETLELRPVSAAHFPKAWRETFDLTVGGQPATDASSRVTAGSIADAAITAAAVATGAIDADALAADAGAELADALLDRANGVETGVTLRQALQRIGAAAAGKCAVSVDGTTITFTGLDGATVRLTVTAVPATGERTAAAGS